MAITGGVLREFIHPTEDRPLTLRECATLQMFPTGLQFQGSVSEKAQLIGNAVPLLLAQRIAESLRQDLAAPGL
jgi:DNA (cytosine-5)-methyltransferase 1